jgi:hypothetical protein
MLAWGRFGKTEGSRSGKSKAERAKHSAWYRLALSLAAYASHTIMRVALIIVGIFLAAAGGVIAFRALYIEPTSTVVITSEEIRELPNYTRVVGGALMLLVGAAVAFLAATRMNRR